MSRLPHYRDAPESCLHPLPSRSLGAGLVRRVGEVAPSLPLAAVFGGRTAAFLHGVDVLPRSVTSDCWPVEVVVPTSVPVPPRPGLRVYRWGLGTAVEQRDGLLVTTPERTALDCARVLPRLDAVAAVDRLAATGVDVDRLRRAAARLGGGESRAVESILDVADPGSQSPLESWTRCLIADAGLPRPTTQLPVRLRDGAVVHLDLGYREFKVGVECDGRRYHGSETDRAYDARRRRRLVACGWSLVVVHGFDVVVRPDELLAELRSRLRQRGWPPSADRLRRIERRIRYIGMALRLDREDWNAAWGIREPVRRRRHLRLATDL